MAHEREQIMTIKIKVRRWKLKSAKAVEQKEINKKKTRMGPSEQGPSFARRSFMILSVKTWYFFFVALWVSIVVGFSFTGRFVFICFFALFLFLLLFLLLLLLLLLHRVVLFSGIFWQLSNDLKIDWKSIENRLFALELWARAIWRETPMDETKKKEQHWKRLGRNRDTKKK